MEPLNYLTPENLQEGGGDGVRQGAPVSYTHLTLPTWP